MNIPCKYLTDQIRSIKAQCNTVYPKICLENAHISVLGVEKYKKFAFSLEGGKKNFQSLFSPFTKFVVRLKNKRKDAGEKRVLYMYSEKFVELGG